MADAKSLVSLTSGSLAFVINLYLAFVIFQNRKGIVGSFSYLLLMYSISAMIYSGVQVLVLPTFLVMDSGYVFYATLNRIPRPLGIFAVYLFVSCYCQNAVILACSFVYRYLTLRNVNLLSKLLKPGNVLIIGICLASVVLFVVFALFYATAPSDLAENVLGEMFFNRTGTNLHDFAYLGAPMFVDGRVHLPVLLSLISFVVVVLMASSLIAFCIHKTVKILRNSSKETRIINRHQRKIFTLLILQLLLPLFFNFLPVLGVIMSSYLCPSLGYYSNLIGSIMTIAQVVDPILVFVYIEQYRKYTRHLLGMTNSVDFQRQSGTWRQSAPA